MTLSTLDSVFRYLGDGSTRVFSFPRSILATADLHVRLISAAGVVSTPSVSKALVPAPPAAGPYTATATFSLGSEPPTGSTVILWRGPSVTQEVDFVGDGNSLVALNRAFDRVYGVLQDERNQGLRVPPWTAQAFDPTLPVSGNAGDALLLNSAADGFVYGSISSAPVSSPMQDVVLAESRSEALELLNNEAVDWDGVEVSAGVADLDSVTSDKIIIIGSGNITSLGTGVAGKRKLCRISGAGKTLVYNAANLVLPGDADIVTASGDTFEAIGNGAGSWSLTWYQSDDLVGLKASAAEAQAMAATNRVLTPANLADIGAVRVLWYITGANMNTTNDQAFTQNGTFTSFILISLRATNPSTSMTTAVGGIYTATSKGGDALVANTQVYSVMTAAGAGQDLVRTALGAGHRSDANLYLSLTTPQGATATADVRLFGVPLT